MYFTPFFVFVQRLNNFIVRRWQSILLSMRRTKIIMGIFDGFKSLSSDINRAEQGNGVFDDTPELTLDMNDSELVKLSESWERNWRSYEGTIIKRQQDNENYWRGIHFNSGDESRPMMDNVIYEAVETFRSLVTKKNPEPFVRGDNTEKGNKISKITQQMLLFHADRLRLKLKLKTVVLFHELYLLAYAKHGWDKDEDDITTKIRRPQNLILDPRCTINEDMEYTGKYIGEKMEATASELVVKFPKQWGYITQKVKGNMGSVVVYTEWWSNNPADYVFWKLDKVILGKIKNPHWNYDEDTTEMDEYGIEKKVSVAGKNHFKTKKAPFTFLSTLNLGIQPHNVTSNIGQNLSNQDIINKRNKQIDRNADSMNGGIVVSGEQSGLNKDKAEDVSEAMRRGGTIWIPQGSASDAIYRDQAPPLPGDIFNQLADKRESLRNIYGVRGSSPSGTVREQTATGKSIIREQDSDRIGGGLAEYLEQFADHIFNWWVQLMYVYYDDVHTASIVGDEKSIEYIKLSKFDFNSRMTVSVKEGSLIPDSDIDRANEASLLLQQGNIDPISAFDRMGFPNPRETAERVYMWKQEPSLLFPEVGQKIEDKQRQQQDQELLQEQTNQDALQR